MELNIDELVQQAKICEIKIRNCIINRILRKQMSNAILPYSACTRFFRFLSGSL